MPSGARTIIEQSGLSRSELAKKSGISTYTIHFACKGQMSEETRDALAKALNVSPEALGKVTRQSHPKIEAAKAAKAEKAAKAAKAEKKNGKKNGNHKEEKTAAKPAEQEPVQSVALAGQINLTLPSEIDDKQKDALVNALFKTRKGKGFTSVEVQQIERWAENILSGCVQLDAILHGKAAVDIHEDHVKVVPVAEK